MSVSYYLLYSHPHTVSTVLSFGTAFLAFSSGALIPVVLHLSALLVYSPILLYRRHSIWHTTALSVALATAKAAHWAVPAWNALSNANASVVTLFIASLVASAIAVCVVLFHSWVRSRLGSHSTQLLFFPAVWCGAWHIVSALSPVGLLTSWLPVSEPTAYDWMIPYIGPAAADWIAAAWAVVLSEMIGFWIMGPAESEPSEETPLLGLHAESKRNPSRTKTVSLMMIALSVLAIPSLIFPYTFAPISAPDMSALKVSCILPPRPAHRDLAFEDYIYEMRRVWARSDILLWPEGAVKFDSESARDSAFSHVSELLANHSTAMVGLSFVDTTSDPADPTGRTLKHRNGLALLSRSSREPHMIYYKRHLVPVAESYDLTYSTTPPTLFTYDLLVMRKQTTPIPVTASICLDLAVPNPFAALESKPALIFAPARTWDPAIGQIMWNQAKHRALELDSAVLWCDGGVNGLSGVAGTGYYEATQQGEGTWTRTIAVPRPFDNRQTLYGRWGSCVAVGLILALFGIMPLYNGLITAGAITFKAVWTKIKGRKDPTVASERALLIDFEG